MIVQLSVIAVLVSGIALTLWRMYVSNKSIEENSMSIQRIESAIYEIITANNKNAQLLSEVAEKVSMKKKVVRRKATKESKSLPKKAPRKAPARKKASKKKVKAI